ERRSSVRTGNHQSRHRSAGEVLRRLCDHRKNSRLAAIADEMGVVLGQTAFSPNIKERHDFSCPIEARSWRRTCART
ncbi:MAG: hydantoinase B/oxoprolinase family protein, partial [Thermoguttaceae bacterium]